MATTPTLGAPAYNEAQGLPLKISDGTNSYIPGPNGLPVEEI